MISNHYREDRKQRDALIRQIGYGKMVDKFYVDRHHKNGAEWHVITSTGLILIYNYRTHKFVTALIARPNQIHRYYVNQNRTAPQWLINIAMEHQKRGYNEI